MLQGKRILLIVAGGIAAYKSLDLVRRLRERGASVRAILTQAGAQFVTPLSLSSLTESKVYQDIFSLTDEAEMGHIQLSREADLLIVAPATADLIAKMAHGLANDLAATALLATDKRVLIAPAMNVRMWLHPATQRNVATLKGDGVHIIGPNDGDMACGEYGPGRMAEPLEIVAAAEAILSRVQVLSGLRALVTAGPTHEPLDPVRFIANRSSGKQGYAIAGALAALGAETTLVSGPTALSTPSGVSIVRVETAREMLAACEAALPADIAVMTAAVADWRPEEPSGHKIKKNGDAPPQIRLAANPDILSALGHAGARRPRLLIGFAAETENVIAHAKDKLSRKGCDWVVANDVSPATGVMGGENNTVHLISAEGEEHWPQLPKAEVATRLAERIARAMGRKGAA